MKRIPALIPILPSNSSSSSNNTKHHDPHQYPRCEYQYQHPTSIDVKRPLPYIPLPTCIRTNDKDQNNKSNASTTATTGDAGTGTGTGTGATIIGRAKLILTTASACQCLYLHSQPHSQPHQQQKQQQHQSSSSSSKNKNIKKQYRANCKYCKNLESWACKFISKQMIQIRLVPQSQQENDNNDKDNDKDNNDNNSDHIQWHVTCIGQNSKYIIQIENHHHHHNTNNRDDHDHEKNNKNTNDNDNVNNKSKKKNNHIPTEQNNTIHNSNSSSSSSSNTNSSQIHIGSIIRFINPKYKQKRNNDKGKGKDMTQNDDQSFKQMEFKVDYITIGTKKDEDVNENININENINVKNNEKKNVYVTNDNYDINHDKDQVIDEKEKEIQTETETIVNFNKIHPTSSSSSSSSSPTTQLTYKMSKSQQQQGEPNEKKKVEPMQKKVIDLMTPSPTRKRKVDFKLNDHDHGRDHDHDCVSSKQHKNGNENENNLIFPLLQVDTDLVTCKSSIRHKQPQQPQQDRETGAVEGGDKCYPMTTIHEKKKNYTNPDDDKDKDNHNNSNSNSNNATAMVTKRKPNHIKNVQIIELLSSPESSLSKVVGIGQSTVTATNAARINQDILNDTKTTDDNINNNDSESNNNNNNNNNNSSTNKVTVYFLHRGRTMSKSRIEFLKKSLEKKAKEEKGCEDKLIKQNRNVKTLEIVNQWEKKMNIPNYIVVDSNLTLDNVCSGLGFKNIDEMTMQFKKYHQLNIVKPDWVIQTKSIFDKPTMDQIWTGMFELKQKIQSSIAVDNNRKSGNGDKSNNWIKRKRRLHQFAPISTISASETKNEMLIRLSKYRKLEKNHIRQEGKNIELSKLFAKISKLYKEMPLDNFDEWRSYSYNAAAAKLKHLDFAICNDEESLRKLSNRKGFGKKFMRQIREFLYTGQCQLIVEFEKDPMRTNVRNMIKIWGVGAKKAVELVKLGYTDISSVRRALEQNKLDLYENARIGVLFYEDFQEKMDRNEVKQISDIVIAAGQKYFQDVEIRTMGSYRRGSEQCGDVDILITHPRFIKCVPKGFLDDLVERLRDDGHISHHLTPVDPTQKLALPLRAENFDDILLRTSKKAESYMGVFVSPVYLNKHRRIDIKFYPYRERAFATIHFTGNGWFNRALRWFAKAKKGLKLVDNGLYTRTLEEEKKWSCEGKRIQATTEKEIFDILGLVYKEPNERDCFDAVVPKDGWNSIMQFDISPTHNDFESESKCSWIE